MSIQANTYIKGKRLRGMARNSSSGVLFEDPQKYNLIIWLRTQCISINIMYVTPFDYGLKHKIIILDCQFDQIDCVHSFLY